MSSSMALRRSPNPGAFTAATLRPPRSLLTTNVAKASVFMGAIVAAASAAAAIEARGGLRLGDQAGDAIAWAVIGASVIAAILVGYRLFVLPEPAEFLSREIGVYLAAAGAIGGILSGLALIATRD